MHISFSSVFTYIYAQAHEYACSVHHYEQLKFFSFTFTAIASNTSLNIALSFPHIQFFQKSFSSLGFVGLLVFSFFPYSDILHEMYLPINLLIQLRHHMYSRFIHVVVRTHRSFIYSIHSKEIVNFSRQFSYFRANFSKHSRFLSNFCGNPRSFTP